MSNTVYARDPSGNPIELQAESDGSLKTTASISGDVTVDNVTLAAGTAAIGKLTAIPGLDIPAHDYIGLTYTGSDLTGVVYKTGGSSGTAVATLTLAYTNSILTSVTKS